MEPIYFHSASHYLSQWHPSPFTSPSHPFITFLTAEQYMMYRKALLFSDPATAAAILTTTKPGAQKKLGRQVKGFDEKVWEREREGIVEEGNWCKFMFPVEGGKGKEGKEGEGGLSLRERLVSTGERELVEASPRDRIWGIGFDADRAEANRRDWGQNLLGKALMRVRERIVAEGKEKEKEGEEGMEKEEKAEEKETEEQQEKTTETERWKRKEKGKGREQVNGKEKGKG